MSILQLFTSCITCRCNTVGKDEEDYRPLFENFLQDLLVTLNKNDWPASEALLTLLGRLLVSISMTAKRISSVYLECNIECTSQKNFANYLKKFF